MRTAMRGDAETDPSRFSATVLSRLLAAAFILTPLVVMLFSEPNHRSGNIASPSGQTAPAARSSAKDRPLVPVSLGRDDQ